VDGETEVVAVVSADACKERWCPVFTEDFSDDGVILLVGRFAEGTGAFLVGRHGGTCYVGWWSFQFLVGMIGRGVNYSGRSRMKQMRRKL
jgi:hypothetical protein